MEIKVYNFLIKFIQTASFAVVLAFLIALCSVLPDSDTLENPGETPDTVPVTAENGSYGTNAEKMEYSEIGDSEPDDGEKPIDTITGAITLAEASNASISAIVPEKTTETQVSVPAPAPVKPVVSVNNQVKPVAVSNPGNTTNSGRDNYDRVIDEYTQAIQIEPNNAAAYHGRGFAYFNKREYDLAIADYTQAIKIDPKNAVTYNNRGAAYNSKGNYDLAIADLDQAIRLNPDFESPYRHRAFAYLKKSNYKQARADVNKAIQINPGNQSAQELSAELRRLGF